MSGYEMSKTAYGGAGNPDIEAQHLVQGQQQSGCLEFHDFLSYVSNIQVNITTLSQNVSNIAALHNQTLQSYDSGSATAAQLTAQLESLVAETSVLNNHIKDDIKYLERDSKYPGDPQGMSKMQQVDKLKRSFDQELKNYQLMESQYRGQYRAEMERQYRIVNPDASPEEVEKIVESGETQVFSQAILATARTSSAQSTLGAVQARHAEIQRIERTLVELVALFEEMAREVEAAEPVVQRIDQSVEDTHEVLVKSNVELKVATKHAWNTRKNKWICLGIVVVIIIIIAVILAVKFAPSRSSNNNSNNNNNNNSKNN